MKRHIVTTYHHSFAGGSKNTSRFFHYLSQNGCDVDAYCFETPQYFSYTPSDVCVHTLDGLGVHSEVIDPGIIKHYSVANRIIEDLGEKNDYILFGANLFPYCSILHDVKSQRQHLRKEKPIFMLNPVGSDIWQIGPQIKSRVKWLLESPLVDCILAYSNSFIDEIREYYGISREINLFPPILEDKRFFPLSDSEIALRRRYLGLQEEDFIIHHHSSMRKIKCPEIVLGIARRASELISERCILLMVGPIAYNTIKSLGLQLVDISGSDKTLRYKSEVGKLTVYWTGVSSKVEHLLQISDVELNASLHDSFNISLMEAMACGVPVVTSDVVGINEHIQLSRSGFSFPTKKLTFDELNRVLALDEPKDQLFDIDAATDAVVRIAQDRRQSKLMGSSGARYVLANFAFDNAANEFYRQINQCK